MNLFDALISPAHAQAAPGFLGIDFMSLLPLLLIAVVFYFLLIRPQQKKAQQHKAILSALKRGDRIVTNGGIIGAVSKIINEQEVEVEIANDVKVRVARPMIASVIGSGSVASEEPHKAKATVTKLSSRKTSTSQKKSRK